MEKMKIVKNVDSPLVRCNIDRADIERLQAVTKQKTGLGAVQSAIQFFLMAHALYDEKLVAKTEEISKGFAVQ